MLLVVTDHTILHNLRIIFAIWYVERISVHTESPRHSFLTTRDDKRIKKTFDRVITIVCGNCPYVIANEELSHPLKDDSFHKVASIVRCNPSVREICCSHPKV